MQIGIGEAEMKSHTPRRMMHVRCAMEFARLTVVQSILVGLR